MSNKVLKLKESLKRLQESAEKIIATSGYTKEAKQLRALEEIIKEQLGHENSRTSARQTR